MSLEYPLSFGEAAPLPESALKATDPPRYPRPSRLAAPLRISPAKAAKAAEQLGLTSVGALLEHLPMSRRDARTVADMVPGETATVVVEVRSISSRPVRRRGMRPIVEAVVGDATGTVKATFFNQPWLAQRYGAGTRLVLHGKYQARNRFSVQSHALTNESLGAAAEVAHYSTTEGLSSTQILALVREHHDKIADVAEPLPARIRVAENLPERAAAMTAAHFDEFESGRRRLAFDELLVVELALLKRRRSRQDQRRSAVFAPPGDLTIRWLESSLPFAPTEDQRAAMTAIDADLQTAVPMQRLLMGEVGSGKTVVALYAMLRAVEKGAQAALMAPTETLAEQHFATLQKLMPGELVPMGLLTGSTPGARRSTLLQTLATGELSIIVGTHALVEEAVKFNRLAVAVIDEQHRFGVAQRRALDEKGGAADQLTPHVLHMTATPIPRTLALTAYGDLDVTELRSLPAGRHPVETYVVDNERERSRAYDRLREELRAGRQAFVVCPLVEESEALQARAATEEFERLSKTELRDFRIVLLHGQMRPKAKQEAMARFVERTADVLVATSVIEVGIDVPNASVMLIENAERYGIAQLHQLRGRVGRGPHESLCLLFGPKESARLRALAEHRDGFKLAEIDLELRGEGEILGTRQSGLMQFRVARLPEDGDLLERARLWAQDLLANDPELASVENVLLGDFLREAFPVETGDRLTA